MIPTAESWLPFALLGVMALLIAGALYLLLSELRIRRLDARVRHAVATDSPTSQPMVELLQQLGGWLRRFYKPDNIEHITGIIAASGFNPHRTLPILLASKFLFTVGVLLITAAAAYLAGTFTLGSIIFGLGIIIGLLGPEWILAFIRRRFVASLERGTPDALDLLVVCSEAGMGLESALERVSQEMQNSNRPMAAVLSSLLDDLRVLPNRREAFTNLSVRSGVEGLKRFSTMLSQSLQYGTPMSSAMRAVAQELRRDRMNKLEEKAVKLPAKLIFPLIFFIMPSLYIVLLGPSFIQLYDSLGAVTRSFNH